MSKEKTEVISFRVPANQFKIINKQARKAKKTRAQYVKELFTDILTLRQAEQEKATAS